MSIIRISMLTDALYAPDEAGNIDVAPFSRAKGKDRRGRGATPLYRRGERPKPGDPLFAYLARSLQIEAMHLPPDAPVTVMVHGFQFDPATIVMTPPHHHKADNPHARLYHFERHELAREMRAHSTSWPLGLGFASDDGGRQGLCVGFGWYSNPGFFSSLFHHGENFYARAYNNAEVAAWQLVCVLEVLADILQRPIDLFCHSLGSRVVVRAVAMATSPLPNLAAMHVEPKERWVVRPLLRWLDRVVLLAGAEKVLEAQLMMTHLNGWAAAVRPERRPSFFNILSRENDVLDKLGENFGPASPGSKQVIGHNGLEKIDPSWVDVQLDDPEVAAWFLGRGYRVSGDNSQGVFAVLDHWIHYTWPDNMRVYHDILRDRDRWSVAGLKSTDPSLFDTLRINRGPGRHGFD